MRKSHFTDSQMLAVLKQTENGVPVPELCGATLSMDADH